MRCVNVRSATAGGISRSWSRRLSRRSRTRSKSPSSNRGFATISASSAEAPVVANRAERGQPKERRVGADFGIELARRAARGLVQRERIEIAAAFVEQIAVIAASPGRSAGSNAAPARTSTMHADERHVMLLGGPRIDAVRETTTANLGKREWTLGARSRKRAIDRRH